MAYGKAEVPRENEFSRVKPMGEKEEIALPKEYAVVKLAFDWSRLSKSEMATVRELWKAIGPVESVFTKQKAPGTTEIVTFLEEIKKYADDELAKRISSYVKLARVNHSIFDAANGDKRLVPEFKGKEILEVIENKVPLKSKERLWRKFMSGMDLKLFTPIFDQRPVEGGLYIGSGGLSDIPREFFKKGDEGKQFREKLIMEFPEGERERVRKGLNSPTNIVVFKGGKPVEFIPYAEYFKEETGIIKDALFKAGQLTDDSTLKEYLFKRSKDVMTENCRESDIAWLKVRSKLNIVVGDVETYLDGGVAVRRDAEIIIYYTDEEKTSKVQGINALMPELEKRLPVTDEAKKPNRKMAPTVVADTLYNAGEAHGSISTVAFSLPNDDEVIKEHGARTTMLYNAVAEKSRPRSVPIIDALIDKSTISSMSKEDLIYGNFLAFLLHEESHPLGGLKESLAGPEMNTRRALGGVYAAIEEAKADIVGLYHVPYLVEKGAITERERELVYTSALSDKFVFLRAGLGADAHVDANILEFNYLVENGGIVRNADGTYKIDRKKFEEGVASLSKELLAIEAEGNAEEGKKLLEKYVKLAPEEKKAIAKLEDIPKVVLLEYPELPTENSKQS
ncbi:hypothetical protein H0N99_05055 [Candidatus Micrarchaeota archaeon]|nr:hypothetical protein [Candidatus Micrarchaeota archaeon]